MGVRRIGGHAPGAPAHRQRPVPPGPGERSVSILAAVYIGLALGFCLGFATCVVMTMAKRARRERRLP